MKNRDTGCSLCPDFRMERMMKRMIILALLVFLAMALPAAADTGKFDGVWIGFPEKDEPYISESDLTMLRFSPEGNLLEIIRNDGMDILTYSGTWQANDREIIFERTDGIRDEITYRYEGRRLILGFLSEDERSYVRIDDDLFPEDPENSPLFGGNRDYKVTLAENGGIRICEYLQDEETVEVPGAFFGITVTEIADNSFCYQENMKHLILPDTVRVIGPHAFEENHVLEDVRLPAALESIGDAAFQYCYSLKEIIIPEGVSTLGEGVFWQCSSLEHAVLPETLREIRPDTFEGSDWLTFFVKPGSSAEQFCRDNGFQYAELDDEGFAQIYGTGTVPSSLLPGASDPDLAGTWVSFDGTYYKLFRFPADGSPMTILSCSGWEYEIYEGVWKANGETVSFRQAGWDYPDELPYHFEDGNLYLTWWGTEFICTHIDDSLFPEDPDSSPYMGENRVYWFMLHEDGTLRIDGYSGNFETVTIPDTIFGTPVTIIGGTAFMDAEGLKHVVVPEGITFIGGQAFANDDELESVQLPNTLKRIGPGAFEYCKSLKEIIIPEGVTSLAADAFFGCESMTKVVLPGSLEEIDEDGVFDSNSAGSIIFTVPQGSYAERYCRQNGFTCVTAEGELLSSGAHDASDEPETEELPVSDDFPEPGSDAQDEDLPEADGSPEATEIPEEEPAPVYGDQSLYETAMSLYNDEKYYSARQAFLESEYGDWSEMAEKCIRKQPATGEIWHDRSQWLQDMELTINVDQPRDTSMFVRIYKDDAPVSYLFISGPDSVTVKLPGNAYYAIKDGVGYEWYGTKEAFGREGSYESMTFDEQGTERIYLQSYYAYTLSINVSSLTPDSDEVFAEYEDWESFAEN